MVKIEVYQACLACYCPSFQIETIERSYDYQNEMPSRTDQTITCAHADVCKLVDGQKHIDITRGDAL